ncbi:MAG: UDP-N-acetylmuramoyl-L-alanyl-D-glutamate--2,6-diaminopimelate ligase [Waddliaceae bacterium]|nr:UDP-N-acetylmuramoyl-L-alanyl-D-glutamate--2,6-diaminopimelate ligase [Waddliaceae bacterium]
MKLKKLFRDLSIESIKGSKEVEITGLCANSKLVVPGNLFIAKKGGHYDGAEFISEAVSAGAVAVLTDLYDPFLSKDVTQVIHPDVASIEGDLAKIFYDSPSESLFTVGITGTNGKTTSAYLIKYLFDSIDKPCGLIGSVEYLVGSHRYEATHTTPDVITNQKLLREMIHETCEAAVMEVTSHALCQGRVEGIQFNVAIFANLTQDHLDYHGNMEAYAESKASLFSGLDPKSGVAVVNKDSPWCKKVLENCPATVFTFAIDEEADLQARNLVLTGAGSECEILYKGEVYPFSWNLVGRFNIYNLLGVISAGLCYGIKLPKILSVLKTSPLVAGRLNTVDNDLGIKIYVDFAHTEDALRNVLRCLSELKSRKLITVFGCGGDRDRSKRPLMGKAAEEGSDYVILTSDNPRSENPQAICDEVLTGFEGKDFEVEVDRRLAIRRALDLAEEGDMILIAGKGHETYQQFAHRTIEFNDQKIAAELCAEKIHA